MLKVCFSSSQAKPRDLPNAREESTCQSPASFMIKTLNNLGLQGSFLSVTKGLSNTHSERHAPRKDRELPPDQERDQDAAPTRALGNEKSKASKLEGSGKDTCVRR